MMKKKVMPLSCLMAAAMLAGCGTAAPAVSEKTTAPAAETAEAAQETAPADAAESEAAAVEETDLTLKDDGTPDALSACTDCAVYIEFNEDGLPSFFAVAQEDVGYQITYTCTDDGRFVMDSAQCVYGYIYNHSAEPTNDFFTPTGEILYQ